MFNSFLKQPNLRWLWVGQTLIYCASQFWFVTLTWLVLQKTGSGIALSTVLMAAAIPRGILMLVGGAISDRFPPNTIAAIAMQGRMMSLVMFAAVALDPFSQAVSGVLLDMSLTGLFLTAGATMLITALVSWLN